jgi:hypothetical protein
VDKATNKTKRRYGHASLAPLLLLATLFWTGAPASGQTNQPGPVGPPIRYQDNDTTLREIAGMDNFLDTHPEIDEQLRKDPSLINNATWVQSHPALQQYLQSHPAVREEFQENPTAFMQREERFDRRQDFRAVVDMDRFLDSHQEIAEQLRKDPSLINNRQWVENHPALEQYLQSHPEIRQEFKADPSAFMEREERFDRREDERFDRREDARGDRDLTRGELASMDQFLDKHREIAEQLRKDPSLINNRQWVDNHPALQKYLQSHQQVREEFRENPNAFMEAENRFDWRERDHDRFGDRDHGELTRFGQFLGGHSGMAQELSKNPSLATNKEYLANHPELGDYLKTHPAMTQQLTANPQAVMSSNWVMQASGVTATGVAPKTKVSPNQ